MASEKERKREEIEAHLKPEKPLSGLAREERVIRCGESYFANEKEVKVWKAWATAEHIITSQRQVLFFCMLLLSVMTLAWVVAVFLWAWGPPSRMTDQFLKWWLVAISGGIVGTAFSTVVRRLFSK